MYSFDLLLKQEDRHTWQLLTEKGKVFHEFRAFTLKEAETYAQIYMSSWGSVRVQVLDGQS